MQLKILVCIVCIWKFLTIWVPNINNNNNLHLGVFHPKVAFTTPRHIKAERLLPRGTCKDTLCPVRCSHRALRSALLGQAGKARGRYNVAGGACRRLPRPGFEPVISGGVETPRSWPLGYRAPKPVQLAYLYHTLLIWLLMLPWMLFRLVFCDLLVCLPIFWPKQNLTKTVVIYVTTLHRTTHTRIPTWLYMEGHWSQYSNSGYQVYTYNTMFECCEWFSSRRGAIQFFPY